MVEGRGRVHPVVTIQHVRVKSENKQASLNLPILGKNGLSPNSQLAAKSTEIQNDQKALVDYLDVDHFSWYCIRHKA